MGHIMVRNDEKYGLDALQAATSHSNHTLLSTYTMKTTEAIPHQGFDDSGTEPSSFPTEGSSNEVPTMMSIDGSDTIPCLCPDDLMVRSPLDREDTWNMSDVGFKHPEDGAFHPRETRRRDSSSLLIPIEDSTDVIYDASVLASAQQVDSRHDKLISTHSVDPPTDAITRQRLIHRQTVSPRPTRKVYKHKDSASFVGVGLAELRQLSRGNVQSSRDGTGVIYSTNENEQTRENPGSKMDTGSPVDHVPSKSKETKDDAQGLEKDIVVEATLENRELMRGISVLGMQDPVWEDADEVNETDNDLYTIGSARGQSWKQSHDSIEEHGSASPQGSRIKMLPPKSEHGKMISPRLTLPPVPYPSSPRGMRDLKRNSSPRGRTSQRSLLSSHPVPPLPSLSMSPPLARRKKTQTPMDDIPSGSLVSLSPASSIGRKSAQLPIPQPDFAPPDGSFHFRKPNQRPSTPTQETLLRDMELAHQVQSIYKDDDLMTASACDLESVVSDLLECRTSVGTTHMVDHR